MKKFLLLFALLQVVFLAGAQPLRLAVAANAQFVIRKLQADFRQRTGIETEVVTGSSGNLCTQIRNGAPFDVFLSADMDFPNTLSREGFAATSPKEYAQGSLIVCSLTGFPVLNWRRLLVQPAVVKIAVANPALAPYGKATEQALENYGLWNQVKSKCVFGESISQVNTFLTTGAVSLGFTTEALIAELPDKKNVQWERVDPKVYEPIRQGMVVLSYAKKRHYKNALSFYTYITSAPARQILKQYGYRTP